MGEKFIRQNSEVIFDRQQIRLWDVNSGKCLNILQGHIHWVRSVAFNSDGTLLASCSHDQTIRLWEVDTGKCVQSLHGHSSWIRSVAFSPNGNMLASGGNDGTIKLWDVQTGISFKTLRSDRPYERMKITGAIGLTEGQKAMLKILGAIEDVQPSFTVH